MRLKIPKCDIPKYGKTDRGEVWNSYLDYQMIYWSIGSLEEWSQFDVLEVKKSPSSNFKEYLETLCK